MSRLPLLTCLPLIAVATLGQTKSSSSVTPIAKVVQLLQDMVSKATQEKEDEATRFSAFNQWCTNQKRIKNKEIKAATDQIEMLAAKIEKAATEIKALTERIQELEEDVSRWHSDTKAATAVRNKEKSDYQATALDLSESLDAVDRAMIVLKKEPKKVGQDESLLQVSRSRLVPADSKRALLAFLQQQQMPEGIKANPEAYGYEFQSGGVIDILEKLKDDFAKQKYDLDAEELKTQHAFDSMAQQLNDNIENANHEIEKKTQLRAETQQAKADFEGEKKQTEADRAEDQKYLDETTGLCAKKSEDFESRQKLRAQELDALQEAISIMTSDDVAGAGDKHLPKLLQRANSFAQLRSSVNDQNAVQTRVAQFLADRAKQYNSRVLALTSQQVAADPFTKVKKMIQQMISKLMQESTEEIEHKGWCDTELTTNKQTRDRKTEDIEQLTIQRDDLTSSIADLTQRIEDLTKAVAELDAAMADATEERTKSKEKNEETIADAKAAQIAVQKATAVLKDFYAKSAQATALTQVQGPADDAPETFDKPYTGQLSEGGGVLDFMEVILTDFVRLESETSNEEASEQDEYDKFMFESKKDKALKQNEIGHKSAKKKDNEGSLAQTLEELKMTQSQLDKAVEYYEKLKPTCVDSGITYEERVQRREAEMQSLQEALGILKGTDLS